MLGIGAWELTIIFAIIIFLFGAKKLPNVATGLGLAIRNFNSALKGENKESKELEEKKIEEKNS